jgi:Tol biopolymer transport system component
VGRLRGSGRFSKFRAAVLLLPSCMIATAAGAAWDIADTGQPHRDVELSLSEGTWMSLDVSPDGRSIVFDLLGDIHVMPAAGGEARLVHGGPAMQRTPSFSPDGRKLLYVSDASGVENAWVSNADGSDARQVTREGANLIMAVTWGADGETIAASFIDGRYPKRFASDIRLFDLLGGSRVIVPTPPNQRDVAEPELSRDGRYVFYTERLAPAFGIYVDANHVNYAVKRRSLETGAVEEMASSWGGALAPRASPDGKRLAFVRRVKDKTVLFDLDLGSNAQRAVYDGLDRDMQAAYEAQVNYYPRFGWFPDSRHVAIWGKGRLFKVDMDTGAATLIPFRARATHRLTEPVRPRQDLAPRKVIARAVRHVAGAPDGKSVLFTAMARVWRKALPDGVPVRLDEGDAFSFEPAYSRDGRRVAFVEWDDERGSALKTVAPGGGRAKSVVASPGVIRQPRFSPDGQRLVYRIQGADASIGGNRARPGVYWVDAGGGEAHLVAKDGDAPSFSPDGRRVYYVGLDDSGGGPAQVLRSVSLEGVDPREHARSPSADVSELRLSPDGRWLAFRDRQQYYVMPYREIGNPLTVSADTSEVPVRRLTQQGGYALSWSADSSALHWAWGPQLFRFDVRSMASPSRELPSSHASIGLEVAADVPEGSVAFTNARLITMQGGQGDHVIERGTVVVERNRITAVGESGELAVPAGAKVIDVGGRTIMPGLIDAHGHIECCFGLGTMPQKQPGHYAALAFGVTTNFDPYPNELESYEATETALAGITVGPRWIGTGSAIWGRPEQGSRAHVPIGKLDDARDVIARKKALGGFVVKSYRYPSRAARQMLVKAGREAGVMVDVEGESQLYNNLTMILDGHMNLEHNLPLANYYEDIVRLMSAARAHHTPTLVVAFGELFGENYMYQTTEAWKDPKVKLYVPEALTGYSPLEAPYNGPPYSRAMTTIHAAEEIYDIGFRAVARSTKRLDDAGVVINVGSHGEIPGLAMHWEMALLAQGGMSNARVLRAATLNVARTLGIDAQVGSLEPGKLADLIVLDRNPLEDIRNTSSVRYTMVNGRLYDSLSLGEIGNYDRPRRKFYWELQQRNGIEWNEAWGRP